MKRALVCKVCDEVSWEEKHFLLVPYHLVPYHEQARVWWTCISCCESNGQPPLRHEQQKRLHTSED